MVFSRLFETIKLKKIQNTKYSSILNNGKRNRIAKMSLNVNEVQSNNEEIEFDATIITDYVNHSACREILQKIQNNHELADVVLIAGVDGIK